MIFEFYSKLL